MILVSEALKTYFNFHGNRCAHGIHIEVWCWNTVANPGSTCLEANRFIPRWTEGLSTLTFQFRLGVDVFSESSGVLVPDILQPDNALPKTTNTFQMPIGIQSAGPQWGCPLKFIWHGSVCPGVD